VVTIRPFQAEDMFSVIKIASETLTEHYMPSLFNTFYETFPEGFIVAEHHHTIVGFIIGIRFTRNLARILMISVKQEYQRQSIGSKLLKALIKILQRYHITQISLEVRIDNTSAIHFYQKHRFLILDTLENFYQNGENAFIMKRVFPPY
jgi:ribosomal-protein-alanine N-acetyltransferase